VAGPVFGEFAELLRLQSIDVYGSPTDEVVQELHEKARLLGNATVAVHPDAAGFVRVHGANAAV
jgi:hypothetical protein